MIPLPARCHFGLLGRNEMPCTCNEQNEETEFDC